MSFDLQAAGLSLVEINLYPYLTWVCYGALLLAVPFFLRRERALFALLLASLPLESAIALDVGFLIRPSYVIGFLLVFQTARRGLRFPTIPLMLLACFALTAVAGIVLNLDLLGRTAGTGVLRETFLRPIVQLMQLTMLIAVAVAVHTILTRDPLAFPRAVRMLYVVATAVALYAVWEIAASYLHLPFLNLDSMRPRYWYIGFGAGDRYILRPHATFIEPIELNNFQFFGLACSLAYGMLARERRGRWWYRAAVLLQLVVLIGSFSRSTLITIILLTPLFILLYPRSIQSIIGFLSDRFLRILAVLAVAALVAYGVAQTPETLWHAHPIAQVLFTRLTVAREDPSLGFSAIGRADAPREIERLVQDGRLWFGVGIGNDANWFGGIGGTASVYSQVLITSGVIGLALFIVFLGYVLWGMLQKRWRRTVGMRERRIVWVFTIGLLAMLMQRLSFSGLFTDTYLWVAFAFGVFLAASRSSAAAFASMRPGVPRAVNSHDSAVREVIMDGPRVRAAAR